MNPRSFPQMGQSESCLLPLSSAAIISPAMTIYCPDQTGTSFLKKSCSTNHSSLQCELVQPELRSV